MSKWNNGPEESKCVANAEFMVPVAKLLRWGAPGTSAESVSLAAIAALPPDGTILYACGIAACPTCGGSRVDPGGLLSCRTCMAGVASIDAVEQAVNAIRTEAANKLIDERDRLLEENDDLRAALVSRAGEIAPAATSDDAVKAMCLALDALEVATTPLAEDRQKVLKAQAVLRATLAVSEVLLCHECSGTGKITKE